MHALNVGIERAKKKCYTICQSVYYNPKLHFFML